MNGPEGLKKIEDSYREQKKKLFNDPFIHLHERMWFVVVEKELMLFRSMLKIAISDESDREFIENATEEDIKEAYRNSELPKKEEFSAEDWVKLFGIAKEAIGGNQKEVDAETKGIADAKQDFNEDELKMLKMIFKGAEAALEAKREDRYDVYDINTLYSLKEKLGITSLLP